MDIIKSAVDETSKEYIKNSSIMEGLVSDLKNKVIFSQMGGGKEAIDRHIARGKLLPRERIRYLLDPGSPFLEFSSLAAYGHYNDEAPGSGLITGIGRISGRECVIIVNDATVRRHILSNNSKKTVKSARYSIRKSPSLYLLSRFRWSKFTQSK